MGNLYLVARLKCAQNMGASWQPPINTSMTKKYHNLMLKQASTR